MGLNQSDNRRSLAHVAAPGALAVVSAFLTALSISVPGHVWLGWVTLIPLLFAVRALSPVGAALFASAWGSALFAFGAFVFPTPIEASFSSWALLTGMPGLYGLLAARVTRRVGFSPLLLALGWVGVELALHPLGLRHGLLAGTQGEDLVLRLIGSYAGYALVAFVVVYVNAWLLTVLDRVELVASGRSLRRATGEPIRRIFLIEIPNYWLLILRPSKPRAPPSTSLSLV